MHRPRWLAVAYRWEDLPEPDSYEMYYMRKHILNQLDSIWATTWRKHTPVLARHEIVDPLFDLDPGVQLSATERQAFKTTGIHAGVSRQTKSGSDSMAIRTHAIAFTQLWVGVRTMPHVGA